MLRDGSPRAIRLYFSTVAAGRLAPDRFTFEAVDFGPPILISPALELMAMGMNDLLDWPGRLLRKLRKSQFCPAAILLLALAPFLSIGFGIGPPALFALALNPLLPRTLRLFELSLPFPLELAVLAGFVSIRRFNDVVWR